MSHAMPKTLHRPFLSATENGNALIDYGIQLADQASLPIFLQDSPEGFQTSAKDGFQTFQCLDMDLRKRVPSADSNDEKYGK
jgi:hypothetical protein